MGLASVIAEINAKLPPGTGAFIGAEHLVAHSVPPRVVWVPTQDSFAGARQHKTANPRALRTRVAGVVAHLWAKGDGTPNSDHNATEQLLNDLVLAIHEVAGGSYELGEGQWLGQDGAELTQLGRGYVLEVRFEVPITAKAATTVAVEITQATGDVDFPEVP